MALYESKRGLRHSPVSIAVLMLVAALILINANCSRAAVLVKSNDTYNGCVTGREEECLIAEDMELELLEYYYSSHVSRVLAQKTTNPGASLNAGRATTVPCYDGNNTPYNCDSTSVRKKGNCRHVHDRGCQQKQA